MCSHRGPLVVMGQARHRLVVTRIRVLRVIARMNIGGPALQVVNLTEGLDPRRFETILLAGYTGPDEGDYLELRAPNCPVRRVTGLGRAPDAVADVQALRAVRR